MFRSVRPYLDEAGISDLVVCYQGAAVVDPVSGTFVLHEPIALETAREAIETLTSLGHSPNCYSPNCHVEAVVDVTVRSRP